MQRTLWLVDFDGTITQPDTVDVLIEAGPGPEHFAQCRAAYGSQAAAIADLLGRWPHHDEVMRLIRRRVSVRQGARDWFDRVAARGDSAVVVSGGAREIIDDVLSRADIRTAVLARRANFGAVPTPPVFPSACRECGEPCKRKAVEAGRALGRRVVVVGDGDTDTCAALVADGVYAVRGSALDAADIPAPLRVTFDVFDELP